MTIGFLLVWQRADQPTAAEGWGGGGGAVLGCACPRGLGQPPKRPRRASEHQSWVVAPLTSQILVGKACALLGGVTVRSSWVRINKAGVALLSTGRLGNPVQRMRGLTQVCRDLCAEHDTLFP